MFESKLSQYIIPGTEKQVAGDAGISSAHLWKLTHKPCNPSLKVAAALSRITGRPISELFTPIVEEETGCVETKVTHREREVNA